MSHYKDDLQKWISVKAKSGKRGMKYHTVEDCQFLESAVNTRPPTESELWFHEPEECANCKEIRKNDD